MSFDSDFEIAWKNFTGGLFAFIADSPAKKEQLNLANIQNIYNKSVYKWKTGSTIPGAFVEKYRNIYPRKVEEMLRVIEEFTFCEKYKLEKSKALMYILIGVLIFIIGYLIGAAFPASYFLKDLFGSFFYDILIGLATVFLSLSVLKTLWVNDKKTKYKKYTEQYNDQIKELYIRLKDIIKGG